MIRILPYWPRDRVLELAPAYWVRIPPIVITEFTAS
jgi:hypothetical protein